MGTKSRKKKGKRNKPKYQGIKIELDESMIAVQEKLTHDEAQRRILQAFSIPILRMTYTMLNMTFDKLQPIERIDRRMYQGRYLYYVKESIKKRSTA